MGTLHSALENGADLYANECQKIRNYRARSTEERRRLRRRKKKKMKNAKLRFVTSCGAHVNMRYLAMIYTHSIGNHPYNTMVVFKMRDNVPCVR